MKKIIFSFAVLALFASVHGTSYAAVSCGNAALNHPEIVDVTVDNTTVPPTYATTTTAAVDFSYCGNGSPEMVIGGWGTTNSGVPRMVQGQVATDDNGIHSTCQWMSGCVDVYHTDWYKGIIEALRTQLGTASFQNWVSLASR